MVEITKIESLGPEELEPYRTLRRAAEHVKLGIFVAEGEKVVRRLLETEIQIVSLLLTESWLEQLRPLLEARQSEDIKVWVAPKKLLESIVGFHLHQGIMAVGKIPHPPLLDEFLRANPGPSLLVALDGLSNADNIGVIARNCTAFGVDGLIVPHNTGSPYLRRSVRVSMGCVSRLRVVLVENLPEALRSLASNRGTRIIAADPNRTAVPIEDANFRGDICIVFGSEGAGISNEVLEVCSEKVAIPTTTHTDSLNVATASGIFLFEAQQQRTR